MKIDLTNCDREPIHIPGKIQNYGYLIALEITSQRVVFCSENINEIFDLKHDQVLGKSLDLFEEGTTCYSNYKKIEEHIHQILNEGLKDTYSAMILNIHDKPYHAVFSVSGKYLVIEFEAMVSDIREKNRINNVVRKLVNEESFEQVLVDVSREVKNLIGFDRVMIYQFLEDGSGKVVAEEKKADLESYMDLHFPESDIPKQARALYVINKTRLIADVYSEDSKVFSVADEVLDMTHCKTRAVSPMHIEYLKNMGVKSSFSVSIVVDGKLWGLIACHHYEAKRIDFELRQTAELLGEIISSVVNVKAKEVNVNLENTYRKIHQNFLKSLLTDDFIDSIIISNENNLLNVSQASGVAMFLQMQYHKLGSTPPKEFVRKMISWYIANHENDIFYTNNISEFYPDAKEFADTCAGVLIVILSRETADAIVWCKPEKKGIIKWAGKPEKAIEERLKNGEIVYEIHPRKSFETYAEAVSNQSENWSPTEIKSAERVKQIVLETTLLKSQELKNLNEKLQEAYDELDTFAYTISHDLKTPLTVMKANAQILHRVAKDDFIKERLVSIINSTDEMSQMMDDILELTKLNSGTMKFTEIEMKPIIETTIHNAMIANNTFGSEIKKGDILNIEGDNTMISQLFQNLIGNALKYSAKSEKPVVEIDSSREKNYTIYKIKDNGIGIPAEEVKNIFQLFKRFSNARDFNGTGVGMTIVKNIVDKHQGEILIESEVNQGTTITLKFPNNR